MKYKVQAGYEDCTYNGILGDSIVKKKFSEFTDDDKEALLKENKDLFNTVFAQVQTTKKESNAQA